ncbi:hypothetical protein F5884DRAFT_848723 [Xylogone sp. PMI_703]|nr:hypothetical protein F5884DRAFT_848723 [Xylogone sp. PMI_703]
MDFIKNAVGGNGQQANTNNPTNQPAAGGSEDYGDKGLDFVEKRSGHSLGREQNEKISDAARGMYEKATGNKVDPKYSN